ncbi:MAG: cell division protein ZapE [Bacilli bacterium]|nr:cell division protein ZapE [Bacilli bacterium]
MESLKSLQKEVKGNLKFIYKESMKDTTFKNLVTKLHLNDDIGSLNTSKLEDSCVELKNCENCPGLFDCKNKVLGHYLYPKVYDKTIDLVYVPCKYKKQNDELLARRNTEAKELEQASFKDIDVTDKNRVQVIKWLKKFYDEYDGIKDLKGLYLHGPFGSGKTYLISALLNELKRKKRVDVCVIYFQEVLRELKDDWDTYVEKTNYYSDVPILLLDDIGAEQVSEWGRDEVLGTILQNRMNKHLTTFFTSNLTIKELEYALASTKSNVDNVKARRIIERIKFLSEDMEIITESKRK